MSKSRPVCDAGANVALGCVDGQDDVFFKNTYYKNLAAPFQKLCEPCMEKNTKQTTTP